MKAKKMKVLESFFNTKNDHRNEFTFEMVCEVLEQEQFEKPELPLQLFTYSINMFVEKHETPLQAVQQFADTLDKKKLLAGQKLFIYKWVGKYLDETEYENLDLTPIKQLLKSRKQKLKADIEFTVPPQQDIREMLKDIVKNEVAQLPSTLKELEPVQRLNIICKLAPFVLPKIEAIHPDIA